LHISPVLFIADWSPRFSNLQEGPQAQTGPRSSQTRSRTGVSEILVQSLHLAPINKGQLIIAQQNHHSSDYTSSTTQSHFSLSSNSLHRNKLKPPPQNHRNKLKPPQQNQSLPQKSSNSYQFSIKIHHLAYKTNSKFQNIKKGKNVFNSARSGSNLPKVLSDFPGKSSSLNLHLRNSSKNSYENEVPAITKGFE
jgi:hypothetical protein